MLYLGIDRRRAIKTYDELLRGVPDCDAHDCGNIQPRINYALATGSLPVLAHPTSGVKDHGSILRTVKGNTGYTHQELLGNSGYTGIEIYCDGIWSIAWWDMVLGLGKDRTAWGFASDDCENLAGGSFNRGWIVVNSSLGPARDYLDCPREDELRQDILGNIRRGNFYAVVRNPGGAQVHGYGIPDRGPAMNIITIDSTIVVSSDPDYPCEAIRFCPNGLYRPEFWASKGPSVPLTAFSYEIRDSDIYVRIEIDQIRSDGELYTAFSQPLYIVDQ